MPARAPKKTPSLRLNAEQQAAVSAGAGAWSVLAGAGAGKTTVLLARYLRLIREGVNPEDILTLTFTSEAARNLRSRVEALDPENKRTGAFLTFHSLALSFATEERAHFPFKLAEFPLATEAQAGKCVVETARRFGIDPKGLRSFVSLQKRTGVLPAEALRRAEAASTGEKQALAYAQYEERLREMGALDFDGLLVEMLAVLEKNDAVRARWQRAWIMCDEAQDNDATQWRLLQRLSERHGNVYAVGDAGQCQPPGTKVLQLAARSRGRESATFKETNIENLTGDDCVLSWSREDQRMYFIPRPVKVGSRNYSGRMLTVSCGEYSTRMTPNHWVWTRFTKTAFKEKPYYIYLMYREDHGFRVGISHVRKNKGCVQMGHRCKQERASAMWILRLVSSRGEAQTLETVYSLRYGIPSSVFEEKTLTGSTPEQIKRVFGAARPTGGYECLAAHGLLFDQPFLRRPSEKAQFFHGYFKTAACNLVPRLMELPSTEINRARVITSIIKKHYEGLVYSLEVEKDHTYIADGIPVGNSLYAFRGAEPEAFLKFDDLFPGARRLYLACNYRSTGKLVSFLREVGPVRELAEKFHTVNPPGVDPVMVKHASAADEAQMIVRHLKDGTVQNPDSLCILARTNRALLPFESALASAGIRFRNLGRSGYFNAPEVKSVLAFLQCAIAPYDSAVLGALRSPFEPTKFLRKKEIADALTAAQKRDPADPSIWKLLHNHVPNDLQQMRSLTGFKNFLHSLAKYRDVRAADAVKAVLRDTHALDFYAEEAAYAENNPVENLNELVCAAGRFAFLPEFLEHVRKVQGASKSKKGVCVSTVHQAKGLEWDEVYLVSAEEGVLPHSKSESAEEEARVFFVAVSRAAKRLTISYSGTPSRFLVPFLPKETEEEEIDVFA